MGRKLRLDATERCEAVLSLLRREDPSAAIRRRYGICGATLYRLRDQFLAAGREAMGRRGGGDKKRQERLARMEKALAERDRVIGELITANRILRIRGTARCER